MALLQLPADRRESFSGKEQWHDSGVGSDDEDNMEETEKGRRDFRPHDVESQIPQPPPRQEQETFESGVSTQTKLFYLGIYFFFNLALTIYNKAVLGKVRFGTAREKQWSNRLITSKFAFPWLLTALHSASAAIGCYGLMLRGYFRLTKLTTYENMVLVAFSFLFTINIAMSNVSL